jgi:transcriptional regulator with XRE-family HTH domain
MSSLRRLTNGKSIEEIDWIVDRLCDYWRTNYITEAELAHRIGVSASASNGWLRGKPRPASLDRILAFLERLDPEPASSTMLTGYEYRPYPGRVARPVRCPFFHQARGKISGGEGVEWVRVETSR